MEVISTSGRGPHTVYTVREGDREWTITGASNLPAEVFQRWRQRQAAVCMRRARERTRQQRDQQPEASAEVRTSQEAGPSRDKEQTGSTGMTDGERALLMITCKICQDREVNRLIVPCGHLVFCADCLNMELTLRKKCPICREEIRDYFGVNW